PVRARCRRQQRPVLGGGGRPLGRVGGGGILRDQPGGHARRALERFGLVAGALAGARQQQRPPGRGGDLARRRLGARWHGGRRDLSHGHVGRALERIGLVGRGNSAVGGFQRVLQRGGCGLIERRVGR